MEIKFKRKYDTKTEDRNRALFENYESVIRSHGEYANVMPKGRLYDEVAELFNLSPARVQKIISQMIKENKTDSGKNNDKVCLNKKNIISTLDPYVLIQVFKDLGLEMTIHVATMVAKEYGRRFDNK